MTMRHCFYACALAVLAAPTVHAAEPAADASRAAATKETARLLDEQRNFERADVDGDGQLSWEEFRNFFVPQFHMLDRNGDGVIRGDEHPAARDAQGNPVKPPDVTTADFQRALRIAFERADKDGSGTLSPREWATPLQ